MSTDERAVLGDELQQRGEPQGELIALQLALEALPATAPRVRRSLIERRIAACLDQHHDTFYGALAPHVQRLSRPDLWQRALEVHRWSGGFATTLLLQGAGPSLHEVVRIARELPIARFVRRLELGVGDHPEAVVELAQAPWPHLRELVLFANGVRIADLSRMAPLLAELELLQIHYAIRYATFEAPALTTLQLWRRRDDSAVVLDARMPALEELNYAWFAAEHGVFDRYPKLRRLTFYGDLTAGWLEQLMRSPNIERLTHLTPGYLLGDADLEVLAAHAHRLAHLELLDVSNNVFSAQAIAAVRPRLPPCVKLRRR